jgi:hypothetical protein
VSELGDQLLAIHNALDGAHIPHAIGGAIALGYCTLEPRGTRDVDVNVFVGPERAREVFAALPDGIQFSGVNLEHAERDGQVRLWWGVTPVDVFLSVLPLHEHVEEHVREVPFEGSTIPVLDCTALTIFKAMFDRPRDWVDIEAMIDARAIDLDEAIGWVSELTDASSTQIAKLETLRRSS